MALIALPGAATMQIGAGASTAPGLIPGIVPVVLDAASEALIFTGRIATSDGGSHTIDTSGSSSLGWRSGTVTFVNAGTTIVVGLAAVDSENGPPSRAVNAAGVITFDVSRSIIGGSGGIIASAWQTHVPNAGTKTIANGDLVAFCIQMTTRGGTDIVRGTYSQSTTHAMPCVSTFLAAAYSGGGGLPNCVITFSDGAIGFFQGSDIGYNHTSRTWNSGSAPSEYGQLFNLPFPLKVYGIYGWIALTANCDVILYSAPLTAPVAERTVLLDANTVASATGFKFVSMFNSPYTYGANNDIAVVFKPDASNITVYYKTLGNAAHRVTESFGTSGYGISRTSGAFADANSSLDHYYIGLLVGAFDDGGSVGGGGRAVQINNDSLVA